MQSDVTTNLIILSIVAIALFILLAMAVRERRRRRRKEAVIVQSGAAVKPKEERLYESKDTIPKLPRNETLYQILKNGTLTTNNILFDLNYVLDEVAALLRADVHSEKIELLFDIDSDIPPQLIGSPKRLSRILINLIENAIRFTKEGVVTLQVKMVRNNGVDCVLEFVVKDPGKGMTEEEIAALKVDPAERMENGRMPLSFYVANALVESEKGSLQVESALGRGTAITFDIHFKLPQRHKKIRRRIPSGECANLRVAAISRFEETGELLRKYIEPFVKEVMTLRATATLDDADAFHTYDLVIVDHHLIDAAFAHGLKAEGIWLIALQSILDTSGNDRQIHYAADYLLSIPFTQTHIIEMLTVFYGEETEEVSETAPEKEESGSVFDHFVSDADIPVASSVSKKDFHVFIGSKLLIVEDNPINQRVIRGLLGDSGIQLYFAENGLEALEVLEEEAPFDLVLMDINMPVLDGIETTRRIRAQKQYDKMPVVAFTGLNLQDQIEKMKEAGMNAHMAKPLNIGRVYSVFNHFLPKVASGDGK